MDPDRRDGVAAGVLFLVTEVAAVAGTLLYRPVLGGTDYVLGAGADDRVLLGALCEVVLALAVVGTAVFVATHHDHNWWWLLPLAVAALLTASVTHELRRRLR